MDASLARAGPARRLGGRPLPVVAARGRGCGRGRRALRAGPGPDPRGRAAAPAAGGGRRVRRPPAYLADRTRFQCLLGPAPGAGGPRARG